MDEEQLQACLRIIQDHFDLEEITSLENLIEQLEALERKLAIEKEAAVEQCLKEALELKHIDRKRQATSEDKKKYLLNLIDQYLNGYPDMTLTRARQYANKAMADYFKCKPYEESTLKKIKPD
ncbi:MAG TPA: hypothetical protein DDW55_09195 [Gammaproteobacteria bacterium]|nr:hypothetical protein [Gammaproteobacteria bacterium]